MQCRPTYTRTVWGLCRCGVGRWLWCAAVLGVGLAVAVLAADASAGTLGGVTAPGLAGFALSSATGAPTVVAHENFTGSNGAALLNTSTDGGGFTWTAGLGAWSVQGNQARSTSVGSGYLLFNGSSSNGSVEATINRNGNSTWDTYVIFNSDSTFSNTLLANWWNNASGSIDLYKGVSGSYIKLAGVTGLYPTTIPASAVVRLESPSNSIIKVYLDGVLKVTYTLTAGEQTTYKNSSHKYVGIGSNADASSTFDNFHVDA